MPNQHVIARLEGIRQSLLGIHHASSTMSASSRGQERQGFINSFLSNVLPPIYRFGSGDATDKSGKRSGQLDVVVEYPFAPSLPVVSATDSTRLYLAESVAAVVEVKSDIAAQWEEALKTASQLAPLRRQFGAMITMGTIFPSDSIPLFVAGYTGWKNLETVQSKLAEHPEVAGVLVIESSLFAAGDSYGGMTAVGALALWGLIVALHDVTTTLQSATTDVVAYAI